MPQLIEERSRSARPPVAAPSGTVIDVQPSKSVNKICAETLDTLNRVKDAMVQDQNHVLCREFGYQRGLQLVDSILQAVSWQSGAIPLIEEKRIQQLGYAQSAVSSRSANIKKILLPFSASTPGLRRFKHLIVAALSVLQQSTKVSLNGVAVAPEIIERATSKLEKGARGILRAFKCLEPAPLGENSAAPLTPPPDLSTQLQKIDFRLNLNAAIATLRAEFLKLATMGQEATILELLPLNAYTAYWGAKFLKRQTLLDLLLKSEPPLATAKGIAGFLTPTSDESEPPLNLEDLPILALGAKNPAVRLHAIKAIEDTRVLVRTLGELSKSKNAEIRKPMGPWHYMAEDVSLLKIAFCIFTNLPSVLRVLPRVAVSRLWSSFTSGD